MNPESSSNYQCLIVISPPNLIKEEVKNIKDDFKLKYGSYESAASQAHITLGHGILATNELNVFVELLKKSLLKVPSFDIYLRDFDFFEESRTFFIGVEKSTELKFLQGLIADHLNAVKPSSLLKQEQFTPHMTIGKGLSKQQFNQAFFEFHDQVCTNYFRLSDIALLYKPIGGAKYQELYIPLKTEEWSVVWS